MTTSDYSTSLLPQGGSQILPSGEFVAVDSEVSTESRTRQTLHQLDLGTMRYMSYFFSQYFRSPLFLGLALALSYLSLPCAVAVDLPDVKTPTTQSGAVTTNSEPLATGPRLLSSDPVLSGHARGGQPVNAQNRKPQQGLGPEQPRPEPYLPGQVDVYRISTWPQGVQWRPPLPLPLQVTREFAPPAQRWLAGHRGVDLAAPSGSPARSPVDGVVTFAGYVVDRPVVTIQHRTGFKSSLEPVSTTLQRGSRVSQGQVVGYTTGAKTCPDCLHWGVRDRAGRYVDPLNIPEIRPAVLLPWSVGGRTVTSWVR